MLDLPFQILMLYFVLKVHICGDIGPSLSTVGQKLCLGNIPVQAGVEGGAPRDTWELLQTAPLSSIPTGVS